MLYAKGWTRYILVILGEQGQSWLLLNIPTRGSPTDTLDSKRELTSALVTRHAH